MKKYYLILFLPLASLADFQGEFCEPENESFLLQSDSKILGGSKSSQITFVRSEESGDEVEVVLNEEQDFILKVVKVKNEKSHEQKERCVDGHESISRSGVADLDLILTIKKKELLSHELKKMIRNDQMQTTVSCQWSAEESPCVSEDP